MQIVSKNIDLFSTAKVAQWSSGSSTNRTVMVIHVEYAVKIAAKVEGPIG